MLKDLETKNLVGGMFVLFSLSIYRTIRYLKSRTATLVLAHARAYWWILRNLDSVLRKRLTIQSGRVIPDGFLQQHGLMLSYLQGLREFARLTSARRKFPSLFSSDDHER